MKVLSLQKLCAQPWGKRLLQDITLNLKAGEIAALTGPNGAGKSSLLRVIVGDFPASAGELQLGGRAVTDWQAAERARMMAFLPQLSLLNFPYTVEEVVLLGRTPHSSGRDADRRIAAQALELTDMTVLRDRLYTSLSGGERQRTQLARVVSQVWSDEDMSGKLLLLDEPTSALDPAHQQLLVSALRQLTGKGCSVIMAIHDFNLACSVADQLMVLDGGRQVALGPPAAVVNAELFQQVFSLPVTIIQHPDNGLPVVLPNSGPTPT